MANTEYTSKAIAAAGVVVATVAAAQLPARDSSHALREILLQADPGNTDNVIFGNEASQSIVLEPGDTFVLPVENPGEVWYKSASGNQTLRYLGRD